MASSRRTVISKVTLILPKCLDGTCHSLTEIAAATGLPLSTTHRLVCDLATWRILERTADGRYGVGLALRRIAASGFVVDVRAQAPLVLADLVQVFDAEARLGVLDNHHVAYLAQAPGGRLTRSTPSRDAAGPCHRARQGLARLLLPQAVSAVVARGETSRITRNAGQRNARAIFHTLATLGRCRPSSSRAIVTRCSFAASASCCWVSTPRRAPGAASRSLWPVAGRAPAHRPGRPSRGQSIGTAATTTSTSPTSPRTWPTREPGDGPWSTRGVSSPDGLASAARIPGGLLSDDEAAVDPVGEPIFEVGFPIGTWSRRAPGALRELRPCVPGLSRRPHHAGARMIDDDPARGEGNGARR